VSLALTTVGILVCSVHPTFITVVIGVVIGLCAVPALNASVATVFHERVPSDLHGRVFGIRYAVGRSLDPVGTLLAGLVIGHVTQPLFGSVLRGAAALLLVVATALLALAIWLVKSARLAELDVAPNWADVTAA
jgi:hypothetical protein